MVNPEALPKAGLPLVAQRLERREFPRRAVEKNAMVTCSLTGQNYACTIVDLSASGARITTPAYASLSGEVSLLSIAQRAIYPATVIWKHAGIIGLQFIGDPTFV